VDRKGLKLSKEIIIIFWSFHLNNYCIARMVVGNNNNNNSLGRVISVLLMVVLRNQSSK